MAEQEKSLTENIKCGHCQNTAPMTLETKYIERPEIDPSPSDEDGYYHPDHDSHTGYQICTCPVCRGVTLRSYFWHERMDQEDISYKILYPAAEKTQKGLPPSVLKAYEAAQQIRHISPNAYGVLLGRVLEIACEDRGAAGDTLDKKLKSLADKKEIPEKLVAVATGVRQLRNIGAHASLGELTEQELPVLTNLTRAILDYVYTAPYLASSAASRLAELKKKTKEAKKAKTA
jgi:Domain of unknown function (DUF4145)